MKTKNNEVVDNSQAIVAFNAALTHEKADTVILCDCSGSMSQRSGSGKSRYEVMRECLLRVVGAITGEAAVILFGGRTRKLGSWETMDADRWQCGGATNLAAALKHANRLNPSHIVVITDGQPNVKATALEQARGMLCRIDVYYCGQGDVDSVQFCRDLVQFGGEAVIDPQCLTMLESVRLFLCDTIAPENAGDSEGGAQ